MTPPASAKSKPDLTYEQARDELIEIVRTLESGTASLSDSMTLWERGEELARICQDWLAGAKARLDAARPLTPPES